MTLETFIAESAVDAAQQIRTKLGPDAVVVNLRQLPSRWFQKPKIEVQAHAAELEAETGTLLDTTDEPPPPAVSHPEPGEGSHHETSEIPRCARNDSKTAHDLLESIGLLPLYAERVIERMHGSRPPWLAAGLKEVRAALTSTWIPLGQTVSAGLHVFIGAPGVGKTMVSCKWLTLSVLLEGKSARVWRLDGNTANTAEVLSVRANPRAAIRWAVAAMANTAEALSVHADVLGVPVERSWSDERLTEDIEFVDLPGVNWSDADAMRGLAARVREFGGAQVHLVVNAAYETPTLLAQARAFAAELPVTDLIVTHLDEEPRWGKLWNLMVGTGLPIRFLSAGQNVPGEFFEASAERVLARVFATK